MMLGAAIAAYLLVGFIGSVVSIRLDWRNDLRRDKPSYDGYDDVGFVAGIITLFWPLILLAFIGYRAGKAVGPTFKWLYTPAEARKRGLPAKKVKDEEWCF